MPNHALLATPEVVPSHKTESGGATPAEASGISHAISLVERELSKADVHRGIPEGLHPALSGVIDELVRLPGKARAESASAAVSALRMKLVEAGFFDRVAASGVLATARGLLGQGAPGLLGAMMLVPAWQLPEAPELDTLPLWLWGDYATWLFASPEVPAEETARYAAHWLKRLGSLERLVQRNAGSAAVQAALGAFLQARWDDPARFPAADRRRQAELRGRMLERSQKLDRQAWEPVLNPRDGRQLRVGFVARHFGPGADLFGNLPCFEQLDPRSFEVFLFPLEESDTPEAGYAIRRVKQCQTLPADLTGQIGILREAKLDVLVFAGDPGSQVDAVTRLALHRLAALQVVNQRTGATTGLPEIDLCVSGALPADGDAGAGFSERLGLVRGPAHSFAFARNADEPLPAMSREQLGLPAATTVLATVVTTPVVSRTTIAAWADILASRPGTHLLIGWAQEEALVRLERFCQRMDAALAQRGVDLNRVMVLPFAAGAVAAVGSMLGAADLFLDNTGAVEPVWLAAALAAGVPGITLRQPDNPDLDAAAALPGQAGAAELIAANRADYVRLATELAGDATRRAELVNRIKTAVAAVPECFDALAASDAFGALLETAYDELAALGRKEFRQQRELLRCYGVEAVDETIEAGLAAHAAGDMDTAAFESALAVRTAPTHLRARYLRGLALLAQGEASRAVDYLLAAVQPAGAGVDVWFALARALRANGQAPQAIETLEVCLRLDPAQADPLFMLLELAEEVGASEIARDVLECLQKVAPDDPRVLAMG